jgi:tetratricopeptide (TPR) repeat protein
MQGTLVPHDATVSWDDVMASDTQAIANDAQDATAIAWRGLDLLSLGYLDRAAADLRHCLDLDPVYELCRRSLALTAMYLGHVQDGLRLFESGLEKGYVDGGGQFVPAAKARGDRLGALAILAGTYPDNPELIRQLFRALTDPAFGDQDRRETLQLIGPGAASPQLTDTAALEALWLLKPYDQTAVLEALWLLKTYDQMATVPLTIAPTIWWARDDPGWLHAIARKAMIRRWRLPEYWRKHGFPPQCKPIGESDFECR